MKYAFQEIFLQSDLYNGDGKEIVMPNVLPENSVCINEKYISTI